MNNPATRYIITVLAVTNHIAGSIAWAMSTLPCSLWRTTACCNILLNAVSMITVKYIRMYGICNLLWFKVSDCLRKILTSKEEVVISHSFEHRD
ncbi:hypothetical protein UFOVP536_3 [uncultured Caudovirales phage]|uniref:Uncharacterized protein n=1 Tax=uncultured Caudovirales phage TaxID=2100421 RepID=A0A6J5MU07_9CAUD|nr:hypothetical protein UFOVP536_3 [uncultured Caudovirales phage]